MEEDPDLGKSPQVKGSVMPQIWRFVAKRDSQLTREVRGIRRSAGVVGTPGGHYKQNQTRNGGIFSTWGEVGQCAPPVRAVMVFCSFSCW